MRHGGACWVRERQWRLAVCWSSEHRSVPAQRWFPATGSWCVANLLAARNSCCAALAAFNWKARSACPLAGAEALFSTRSSGAAMAVQLPQLHVCCLLKGFRCYKRA